MRELSEQFLADLREGLLAPLCERVLADHSLCLEIRDEYVNIYYRGGNLLRLSVVPTRYSAFFDPMYARGDRGALARALPDTRIGMPADVEAWIDAIPKLKLAMDLYLGRKRADEREAQQLILRENNFGGASRATDYYICDIEYANEHGRFDMVAVHWPSDGVTRKDAQDRRLVLIEVKHGDSALKGASGMASHIKDVDCFLADPTRAEQLKHEMLQVFNQKRSLGLINCGKDLVAFSDERPMLLLVLVNHDPAKSALRETFAKLPRSRHAEVHLASGCLMGYGLFDPAIEPLDVAMSRFEALI